MEQSGSGRRSSSRLSGKSRAFYGVSPRRVLASKVKVKGDDLGKEIKEEVNNGVNGDGNFKNVGELGREVIDLGEDLGTNVKVEEEDGGDHSGKRLSPRFAGKRKPFYGCSSNRKMKSNVKGEKAVIEEVAEFGELKEGLLDLKGEEDVEGKAGSEKRTSSRLVGKKRPLYCDTIKKVASGSKTKKISDTKVGELDNARRNLADMKEEEGGKRVVDGELMMEFGNAGDLEGKHAHEEVKKTIRLFNKCYLQQVREREQCKKLEKDNSSKGACKGTKSSKKGNTGESRISKRPDLQAVTKMTLTNRVLNRVKRFGNLPGIDVGHLFYSRAEMVVVGLHGHWLKGIDFMTATLYGKLEKYNVYEFPLAVSIVLSGIYEDDVDNSEDVVYTGEGGNNLPGNLRQVSDQVMAGGNLALKNNMEQNVPVRVIRGHKCASSYSGKVYSYDGLYNVIGHWSEKGISGFTVFKYRLRRMEGQPVLTTDQVRHVRIEAPSSRSELHGMVCNDISGGLEKIPVPATNLVDNPPFAPNGYTYCTSIQLAEDLTLPTIDTGCSCKGDCIDPRKCGCAKLNGADFPYVGKDGGRLVEAKAVVFECGPNCKCGPNCVNKTSQRGLRYRLEVFRTPNKGWAVRSWDFIPSGAPVCEYIGKLMRTSDMDDVSVNDFIFEIDCLETIKGLDGRESRDGVVSLPIDTVLDEKSDKKKESEPEFCLDANKVGSVARFINHSCDPNLFVQCVLSSHHDIRLARVVLFASDDIPPLQELTYDYGYALDSVIDPDGKIKVMPCHCGATDCRKRLY
ncbi:[histone H3]-lysine(4) N-trimethyltransferase [Ranunculus cassubicifolius]